MRRAFQWILARRWRRWSAGAGVFMLVVGVTGVELTSQSWFCNSCHLMGTYYRSWQTSAHRDIQCVKCHIEPGMDSFLAAKFNGLGQVVDDVLHRTSTKPSASVSQLACTRAGCHSMEKIRQTEAKNGTFKFRHDRHVGLSYLGIDLACSTCHSHIKGDEHFELNTSVCITCHLLQREPDDGPSAVAAGQTSPTPFIRLAVREGHAPLPADAPRPHGERYAPSRCVDCHEAPKEPFKYLGLTVDHAQYLSFGAACESCHRGTTLVPGPIEDGSCLDCHTFGVERSLPTEEMHHVHSQGRHKIECLSCHGMVRHGPAAQTLMLQQFDCRRCHVDQHAIQRSTYLSNGVSAHPNDPHPPTQGSAVSPMFMAHVDCTGCHVRRQALSVNPLSGAQVSTAGPEACDQCHQAGLGERMIPLWQSATRKLYQQVTETLAAAEASAAGPDAEARIKEARDLLRLVRVDGSWGVHNPRYTQWLLEQARDKLSGARTPTGEGP